MIHDQLDLNFGFGHDDDDHHGQSEYCKWNILAISRPEKDNGDCREPISELPPLLLGRAGFESP